LETLEQRLKALEQQTEIQAPDDCIKQGTDLDQHTMSLSVRELMCSMKQVELSLANALTHRDLISNNQRVESDLHKFLNDVSAESRRELMASMQESFREARGVMQSHDSALARRAQAHNDSLTARYETQARAVDAVRAHNEELSFENAKLTTELEALQENFDALTKRERRCLRRKQARVVQCCLRMTSNSLVRNAWMNWKRISALKGKLMLRTQALEGSAKIIYCAYLRQCFSKWYTYSRMTRVVAEKRSSSIKSISNLMDRATKRLDRFAFMKWKKWVVIHTQMIQRQMEQKTKKMEAEMASILDTIRQIKNLELETVEKRLKSSAAEATSDVKRKILSEMSLELKHLDASLCSKLNQNIKESTNAVEDKSREASEALKLRLTHANSQLKSLERRVTAEENVSEEINKDVKRNASDQSAALQEIDKLHILHKDACKNTFELQKYATKIAHDLKDQNNALHSDMDAHLNVHKASMQGALDAISFDLRGLEETLQKQNQLYKPSMLPIATMCNDYEDLACRLNFSPPFPETAPHLVATFATSMAKYITDVANHEALERVFRGPQPEIPINTEASVEERQTDLMEQTRKELYFEASVSRPEAAGAPRESARRKFLTRVMETVDAALSKNSTVVMLAHTRFGRIQALPTCVACDRPLPTRSRKEAPLDGNLMNNTVEDDKSRGKVSQDKLLKSPGKHLSLTSKLEADANDINCTNSGMNSTPIADMKPDTRLLLSSKNPEPSKKFIYRGGFRMPAVAPMQLPSPGVREDFYGIKSAGTQGLKLPLQVYPELNGLQATRSSSTFC